MKGGVSMEATIYKVTCTINGLGYVGVTKNLKRRMVEHRYDSKTGRTHFSRAIHQYGWENFRVEVLEVCDVEIAGNREKYWIKELDTLEPHGYNCTTGGNKGTKYSAKSKVRSSFAEIEKTVFPILQAELNKQEIPTTTLARMLGCDFHTVVAWMYGRNEIKLSAAIKIKEMLGVDMPLEELFAKSPVQQNE